MFSKRVTLHNRKFDTDFFKNFVSDLEAAGFNDVKVMLPHNLLRNDEKDLIGAEDFIKRERNYVSVILIAKNAKKDETIKILFINESAKAFFKDDTFPSGHSEPFEVFVQGPDPARVFALMGFLKEKLSGAPLYNYFFWITYLASFFIFILELLTFSLKGNFIFKYFYNSYLIDVVLFIYALIFMLRYYAREKGLYVKKRENMTYQWIKSLLKGEYANNPFSQLIVTVIAGIIVYLLSLLLNYLFNIN